MKQNILDIDLDGPDQRFIESELIPDLKIGRFYPTYIHLYGIDKMIAKDFSMQGLRSETLILCCKIFEECARYHIWIEYELGPSNIDNLNSRNLNERLKTLNFYDRDHEKGRINHNEAEFRAYYILQHVEIKTK